MARAMVEKSLSSQADAGCFDKDVAVEVVSADIEDELVVAETNHPADEMIEDVKKTAEKLSSPSIIDLKRKRNRKTPMYCMEGLPAKFTHNGHTYSKKNSNLTNYQMDCRHKHGCECPAQMRFPVINGKVDMSRGWTHGEHSRKCIIKSGLDASKCNLDGHYGDADDNDTKKPAAVEKTQLWMQLFTQLEGKIKLEDDHYRKASER
ncbi:hypothetical protein ACHAXA_006260 [Cyclostephanos tholiformis]|uniref:Uncharacterized protein n=1 Tax=Cyclostephanos tholiformis TaxID=382380 RepID=A0ABD3SNR4_9STRA